MNAYEISQNMLLDLIGTQVPIFLYRNADQADPIEEFYSAIDFAVIIARFRGTAYESTKNIWRDLTHISNAEDHMAFG